MAGSELQSGVENELVFLSGVGGSGGGCPRVRGVVSEYAVSPGRFAEWGAD